MKRKAIWWLRVGLLALAGAPGCVRCTVASKEPCPCQYQAPHQAARRSGECGTPCASGTPYLSCSADKPTAEALASAAAAAKDPAAGAATTTLAAKPSSLPEITSAPARPTAPAPAVATRPKAPAEAAAPAASRPKVRVILTGTEEAPAKPATGPQMPSHLPELDLPAPAEGKPAVKADVKDEEGPPLFPDEPARPAGVELAVAKDLEGPGHAVHAYLPARYKPDVPAVVPVSAVVPTVLPAPAGPKAPARPLRLPDPPPESRRVFPCAESGPVRRSYSDVTAARCFAHGADYGWLCGRVEYSRLSKGWRLRYASVDEDDRFGGSVTLVPEPKLDALKDGQYVRVTGRLADHPQGLSPEYEVESITPVKHPNAPQPGDSEPGEF